MLNYGVIWNPVGKNRFTEDWDFLDDRDSGYLENEGAFRRGFPKMKTDSYDKPWNIDTIFDDYDEDEDGWSSWDSEE